MRAPAHSALGHSRKVLSGRSRRKKRYHQATFLAEPYRDRIRRGSLALTAKPHCFDLRVMRSWVKVILSLPGVPTRGIRFLLPSGRWRERRCFCSTHSCHPACHPRGPAGEYRMLALLAMFAIATFFLGAPRLCCSHRRVFDRSAYFFFLPCSESISGI